MPQSLRRSDLSSIAFTTASSMILMRSSRPSGSKPHDSTAKREQNPHYGHYNGLKALEAVKLGRIVDQDLADDPDVAGAGDGLLEQRRRVGTAIADRRGWR